MKKLLVMLLAASLVFSAMGAAFARPRGSGGPLSQPEPQQPQLQQQARELEKLVDGVSVVMDGHVTPENDKVIYKPSEFGEFTLTNVHGSVELSVGEMNPNVISFVVESETPSGTGRIVYGKRDGNTFQPVASYFKNNLGFGDPEMGGEIDFDNPKAEGTVAVYMSGLLNSAQNLIWCNTASLVSYKYMDYGTVPGDPTPPPDLPDPTVLDPSDLDPRTPIEFVAIDTDPVPLAEAPVEIIDEEVPLADGIGMIPLNSLPLAGEGNLTAMLCLGLAVSVTTTGASAMVLRRRHNA